MQRFLVYFFLVASISFSGLASAQLPQPQGEILLTLTGKLRLTNQGKHAVLDADLINQLEQHHITTQNPWFSGLNTFTGPKLTTLIQAVGAEQATSLRIHSINGFSAEIPVQDLTNYQLILAFKVNNQRLKVRELGPLFIVYPFDTYPNLQTEMYYNRSVWQINRIDFL